MRIKFIAPICLLALVVLCACKPRTDRTVYAVRGTVERTYPGEPRIQIAHEEIPGYMEPMSMDFIARDPKVFLGLDVGDRVRFDLVVTRESGWVENVRRIGKVEPRSLAKPASRLWVAPLKAGEVIPDIAFTNELGRAVKLSDYRGQALAITFIFTRCPFPDYCPRMGRQLAQVHESLSVIPNAPTNWHLFSVSFDPEFDSPDVLRDYRRNLRVPGARWQFLTGAPEDIKEFCSRFGVYFMRDRGTIDHNLMTAVIDTQGRLQRLFPGNKWMADELIDELAAASLVTTPNNVAAR